MVLKGLGPYHKYGLSLNLAHVKSDERKFIFKYYLSKAGGTEVKLHIL